MKVRTSVCLLVLILIVSQPGRTVGQEEKGQEKPKAHESARELVLAAAARDRDKIKNLLADGADINARDAWGLSPYLAAKIKGNDRIATMLEVLGAETDVTLEKSEFLEKLLDDKTESERPGIALLVAKDDDVLYQAGGGAASIEHDVAITPNTKFRIGSVTKQFTAAAILKLQEDGQLSVEDKLSKFVPDFPRGDEVTLHHLLTHTSGLKSYTSDPEFYETVASQVDAADYVEEFREAGFNFDPGEKFEYCNTGYFLLAHIVERVSEKSFDEFLKDTFFEPNGMHDTGVHQSTGIYKHEATGYSVVGDELSRALDWDMSRAGGAGNLYSTVGDLHKWNQAIFGGKILSEETLQVAHTINQVDGESSLSMPYGYGWIMDEHRGLKRIGHSGGLHGFVSQLNYYPEHGMTFVALHNAFPSDPGLAPGQICDSIAEVFLWEHMKARPKHEVDESIKPDTYDDYVGRYDYLTNVMTVTRDGDKLMAQLTGQPKFEIFPEGKDKFFWKVVDATAVFQRDDDGKVTGVRHAQGISKFLAPKIEERVEVELSEDLLDRFVGQYSYGPLGKLTIRRDGEQLLAQMTGQPEHKVFPESETVLFWRVINATLEFELDDEGQFTSITHTQAGQSIPVKKVD